MQNIQLGLLKYNYTHFTVVSFHFDHIILTMILTDLQFRLYVLTIETWKLHISTKRSSTIAYLLKNFAFTNGGKSSSRLSFL